MCITDGAEDAVLMTMARPGNERDRIIVIALGEAGAKVLDRAAAECCGGTQQPQWFCYRTDYSACAYEACWDADAYLTCASSRDCYGSGCCADLASCSGKAGALQAEQNSAVGGMKALSVKEVSFEQFMKAEYALICVDRDQGCNIPAAAYLTQIAREQGCRVIGVVTTGKPIDDDAFEEGPLQEGLEPLYEAADCLLCLPRAPEQTPESLLWPAAHALAGFLAVPDCINLDFEDIQAMFQKSKTAWTGTGSADGADAAESAVNDLLACIAIEKRVRGASELLAFITCPPDTELAAIEQAVMRIENAVGPTASVHWKVNFEEAAADRIRITVIAAV